ncbi:unnamed protein product [Schistosoma margrebowiei]|uniref:Uncharacterized protein n=1 Tax=Schistosoma margrebowiei TaxID=48269 RepID=A0A183MTC6_9TREM|nr:unnamed protein product [Schistosoma margrebowiei]
MQLDDLNFADDPVVLSHTQQQMQEKTTSVAAASSSVGFNIHKRKSKILWYNTTGTNQITLDGEGLEDARIFTYLRSIIGEHGGSDADMKARIGRQQRTVGENQPDSSGGRNQEEALGVESIQLRHKASPHLGPSRPKDERKIKEHITPRNEDRHEKNEQQLDRTRNEGSGQCGLCLCSIGINGYDISHSI